MPAPLCRKLLPLLYVEGPNLGRWASGYLLYVVEVVFPPQDRTIIHFAAVGGGFGKMTKARDCGVAEIDAPLVVFCLCDGVFDWAP